MHDPESDTEHTSDVLHELDVQAKQRVIDTEDSRLEGLMEDVFSGGYEPYEPNMYDGTYSEE